MEQEKLLSEIKTYLANPINPELKPYNPSMIERICRWLMAYAPGRYRMFCRQLQQAPIQYRVASANGFLEDISRRLEKYGSVEQVEQALDKIIEEGINTQETTTELVRRVAEEKPDVSPVSKRQGKRADHDSLPDSIKARYEENLPLIQQIRSKHERMKVLYRQLKDQRSSRAAACDIEETVHNMNLAAKDIVKLNDKRIENWQVYDSFEAESGKQKAESGEEAESGKQKAESGEEAESGKLKAESTLDADAYRKLTSTNVSYISRYTTRLKDLSEDPAEKVKFVSLREEMQKRVNELLAAGWTWPENSKHRPVLEKCGVKC